MKLNILFILALILICGFSSVHATDLQGDTIYLIMVDRFCDGNPGNNPQGAIFSPDRSNWRLCWGGDIDGIIGRLPYIKKLGCTAIWLTPVVDNTESLYVYGKDGQEKISAYHGYWGRDFYSINRYFGTEEKFRELVEKAHELGMKVIFDFVLNHTSPIGQGIDGAIYRNGKPTATYSTDPEGWFHHAGSVDFNKNEPAEWQDKNLFDLADLNTENPKVQEYLISAIKKWMDTGIDAVRLDTVRHIPPEFAGRFYNALKEKDPHIFVFGEWSMGGSDVPGTIDFVTRTNINPIDFMFGFKIADVLCRNQSFERLAEYIRNDRNMADPNRMVTCIDNHDMSRFLSQAIGAGHDPETAKKRTHMATYILLTSRGIPCIYYGTEHLLHVDRTSAWGYGGEPYNRQMMDSWDTGGEFFKGISKLAKLRRETPALISGIQRTADVGEDFWAFERICGNSRVLVVINRGPRRTLELNMLSLPDGRYDNSNYAMERVMGQPIEVKNGSALVPMGSEEVGVWRFRGFQKSKGEMDSKIEKAMEETDTAPENGGGVKSLETDRTESRGITTEALPE